MTEKVEKDVRLGLAGGVAVMALTAERHSRKTEADVEHSDQNAWLAPASSAIRGKGTKRWAGMDGEPSWATETSCSHRAGHFETRWISNRTTQQRVFG